MNRKVKTIIFVTCSVAFIGLTILFGWLGFTGDKTSDRMALSYTDKITFADGESGITGSGLEFRNENATRCRMNIKWGNPDEEYGFITLVKVTAPSGEVAAFVTGDTGDFELEFDLEETGTYRISSEYYADAYEFQDAVWQLDTSAERIEIENGNTFDGFVFTGEDCDTSQTFDIRIVELR